MNEREFKIKKKYEDEGWKMLRNGAPDFLAIKINDETEEILEFKGVEVKSPNDRLRYEQSIYKKVFESCGIPYVVEVVE